MVSNADNINRTDTSKSLYHAWNKILKLSTTNQSLAKYSLWIVCSELPGMLIENVQLRCTENQNFCRCDPHIYILNSANTRTH